MAKDVNKVMITGRLGANPRLRSMNDGTPVTTFRVASNRRWLSEDGTTHDDTEWFRVVAWNKLAERCAAYLHSGAHVYVEGRLQTRTWQDRRTGRQRSTVEVIAQDMIRLTDRTGLSEEGMDVTDTAERDALHEKGQGQ